MRLRTAFFLIFILVVLSACTPLPESTPSLAGTSLPSSGLTPEASKPGIVTPTATLQPTITTVPLEIEANDLQSLTLQFWHPWHGELAEAVEGLVKQFNAENPFGIAVSTAAMGGDLYLNLREGIRTGVFPQVVVGRNFEIQSWDDYRNVVIDLNPYVYDPAWGLGIAEITDFYTPRWEQDQSQGKRLGLPAQTSAAVLFYNRTWALELGYDSPPGTPAAFKDQACAAAAVSINAAQPTHGDNQGIGGWIASSDTATTLSWFMAFGEDGLNNNGDGYEFNTAQGEEALGFIKSLFRSGCAWIPENRYPNEEFAGRRGLFYSSDILDLPFQLAAFESNESEDAWIPLAYPGEAGPPVINLYGSSYAILESTPAEQLAAWLFIKWMVQPANQVPFILASGYLPTRSSVVDLMADYARDHPQWEAALELIPYSRVEPGFGSWEVARWAISDAASELVDPGFSSDRVPQLLMALDALLAEIHSVNR